MEPVVIAVMVGIAAYMAIIALIPKKLLTGSPGYTRSMLQRLSDDAPKAAEDQSTLSVLREAGEAEHFADRIFFTLPGARAAYPKILKAGMSGHMGAFLAQCLGVLVLAVYLLRGFSLVGVGISIIFTYIYGIWTIHRNIRKRNDAFINNFPDALDMIVRSVKSGYPLNSAVRMVADNMQPPVSYEFKQVADEIAYGSTLIDALSRLALRIDEPDVRFFVIVLSVQQDIGGNLSEVLNNLASIIRKRKHLRMKIRALASEGRATAWVLGSMPVAEAGVIALVAPSHLTPLFDTHLGNIILAATLGMMGIGAFMVRQMVNIRM